MLRRIVVSAALALLLLSACNGAASTVSGSGTIKSERRQVGAFNQVSLGASGDVTIARGATDSLTIAAVDNLLPLISTVVHEGELVISSKSNTNVLPSKEIPYTITVRDLQGVALASAGSITAVGLPALRAASLGNSGQITVAEIANAGIVVDLGGSGDITLLGKSNSLQLSIGGAGSVSGGVLAASVGNVRMGGSGSALINASDTRDVNIAGSGTVRYRGAPTIHKAISGAGWLQQQ
jgi:hypothetical protein